MNNRIKKELDSLKNMVNTWIQRALNEAVSTQVLSQIQSTKRYSHDANNESNRFDKVEPRSEDQYNHHRVKSLLRQQGSSRDNLWECLQKGCKIRKIVFILKRYYPAQSGITVIREYQRGLRTTMLGSDFAFHKKKYANFV